MTAERGAQVGNATQATAQRSRWGRIWPWALLWGAAPMPLYIWLVVGMVV
jgi:Na+/melibiose symporter-like transporter